MTAKSNKTNALNYTHRIIRPKLNMLGLMDPDPLSPEKINETLVAAGFATQMHEDTIYLQTSEAPVVVTHIQDSDFVDISTSLPVKPGIQLRRVLRFINALNYGISNARFFLRERTDWSTFYDPTVCPWLQSIHAEMAVPTEEGNLSAQLLPKCMRAFIRAVDQAAHQAIEAGFVDITAFKGSSRSSALYNTTPASRSHTSEAAKVH
jgi:hypothetical protein